MITKPSIGALLLLATHVAVPNLAYAHGSPAAWTAEATDFGCWITRWLVRDQNGAGGETAVGIQVVLGRIVPPRSGQAQPGVTQAELDGATTINVRTFDPSAADATSATVVSADHSMIELAKRHLEGELGEFPSFYVTGGAADAALTSLRAGKFHSVVLRGPEGTQVDFANTQDGLRVALAMYDACVKAKQSH